MCFKGSPPFSLLEIFKTIKNLCKIMAAGAASLAGLFSVQKWGDINLFTYKKDSPFYLNVNEIFKSAIEDKRKKTIDELLAENQELKNLFAKSIQQEEILKGEKIKVDKELADAMKLLKGRPKLSWLEFSFLIASFAVVLGVVIYKGLKLKKTCNYLKLQLQTTVEANTRNLDGIIGLIEIRAQNRRELIEIQKKVNDTVIELRKISSWRVNNDRFLEDLKEKIPVKFGAIRDQVLKNDSGKFYSVYKERSGQITRNIKLFWERINSPDHSEWKKKLPSHVLYNTLLAGTIFTIFQLGLLPVIQDTFLPALRELNELHIAKDTGLLSLESFMDTSIPYTDIEGNLKDFKLSQNLSQNQFTYDCDRELDQFIRRCEWRVVLNHAQNHGNNLRSVLSSGNL